MRKICNFIIKYSLYGLVFFMPLLWLPWATETHEFNKQYLLVFLVGLSFLAWLAKMIIVQKKISFRRTPLDIWILTFMAIIILSSFFSIDKISTLLGFYGRYSDSLIGILSLCVMYFVVVNNISLKDKLDGSKKQGLSFKKIINLFLVSSSLVVAGAYLSVFSIWDKIPNLFGMTFYKAFNFVSVSLEGLAMFLVVVISVLIGSILVSRKVKREELIEGKKSKIKSFLKIKKSDSIGSTLKVILIIISSVLLIMINFWPAWFALGIVTLFLLIITFWTRAFRKNTNLLMIPILLLLISAFYLFGFDSNVGFLDNVLFVGAELPYEINLDSETSKIITWQTLKEYPVLGSGLGTYIHNFSKFKPTEFNQSNFWNVKFDKSHSHLLEMISSIGILGILSYLIIIFIFLLIISLSLQKMRSKKETESELERKINKDKLAMLPFFLGWLALVAGQFVYMQNTVLSFYFWLFTALGIIGWQKIQATSYRKITFSFKKMPEIGLVMNIILLIIIFAMAGLFYLGGKFYYADIVFNQPVETNKDLLLKMEKVVNLNGYRDNYRRVLSQVYLINAWDEVNKAEEERDAQLLQALAAGSIEQARTASLLNPNYVSVWENLGKIYRDSQGLVGGVVPFALDAFAKASELEPNNPFFYRERCRINLVNEEKNWEETVAYCQKAVELKENYLDAHIQLALVYEGKGEIEEAIKQMESVLSKLQGVSFERGSDLAGAATEIYFQLGRLYFNLEKIKEAIPMFEQAVIITPQYANARYALGLSYQADGRNEDALIQYQIIDQLVPDNEVIKNLIQQLSNPVPVLEGEQVEVQNQN